MVKFIFQTFYDDFEFICIIIYMYRIVRVSCMIPLPPFLLQTNLLPKKWFKINMITILFFQHYSDTSFSLIETIIIPNILNVFINFFRCSYVQWSWWWKGESQYRCCLVHNQLHKYKKTLQHIGNYNTKI